MKKNSHHNERIVIDGNHDFDRDHEPKRDFMAEYAGVATVLRNEVVEVAGGKMSVVGVTWDACKNEYFADAENSIQTWNASGKRKVDLVLSHLPPRVKGGGSGWRHGSDVLSHFVNDINPPLHCFGHIHYARGVRVSNSSVGDNITMVNCASTWMEPVVVDYCRKKKSALMVHCPVSEQSVKAQLRNSKVPKEWIAGWR